MNYELRIKKIMTLLITTFLMLVGLFFYKDALAACDPGSSPPRAELLVTSPTLSGKFYTSGKVCIVNVPSSVISFDTSVVPNYDNLKEDLYTRSIKFKIELTSGNLVINSPLNNERLYHSAGDLSVNSVSGSGIGLVFVDGNLEFPVNILYGKNISSSGLIFIVKGNVYIRSTVTEINAGIIAEGRIYTAAPLGGLCDADEITQTLVINGNLISINPQSPINFCRNKVDNRTPAEIINHQAKYLVLLKNVFFDTIQKWSEIVELPNINLVAIPIPPTVDLRVAPPNGPATDGPITLNSGQSAMLSWATSSTPNNIPQNCIASASPPSGSWTGLKPIPGGSETTGPLSGPQIYTYNLKCSNEAGEFTDTVTVNVNPPFDYSLTASSNITVLQGQPGSNNINLSYIGGPAEPVTLTAAITPQAAGATITLSNNPCTPTCTAPLTVTTATTTPAGTYTVSVTGNGGGIIRTTSFTLKVNAPPPTVTTLALSPGDYTHNSANLKSSVNPNGLPTTVWYKWNTSQAGSCASWPNTSSTKSIGSGTTAISPNIINTGTVLSPSTTYSFCAAAQSSAGTVYGNKVQFTTLITPFDYNLTNSGNITVTQGQNGSSIITRTLVSGTTQSVTLSASGLPSGATAQFTSNPCNPTCSSTLNITTSTSTPVGTYTINVTGPSTITGAKSISLTLTVNTNAPTAPPTLNTFSGPACSPGTYSATISWSGPPMSSTDSCPNGYWVDISTDNFGTFYNKCVQGTTTITTTGTDFNSFPTGSPAFGGFQPGTTYYVRVFNGFSGGGHSNTLTNQIPACVIYDNPLYNGYLVDNCKYWATQCGQPAADYYCNTQGYASALGYTIHGSFQGPTYVIGSNQVCPWDFCIGFQQIRCTTTPFCTGPYC